MNIICMRYAVSMEMMMMMMMVLCPKAGLLAFTPPGDEMSEVVSRCLFHRQLWVSNLSKVSTQWHEVDLNLRPSGCKALNITLHHRIPYTVQCVCVCVYIYIHAQCSLGYRMLPMCVIYTQCNELHPCALVRIFIIQHTCSTVIVMCFYQGH